MRIVQSVVCNRHQGPQEFVLWAVYSRGFPFDVREERVERGEHQIVHQEVRVVSYKPKDLIIGFERMKILSEIGDGILLALDGLIHRTELNTREFGEVHWTDCGAIPGVRVQDGFLQRLVLVEHAETHI